LKKIENLSLVTSSKTFSLKLIFAITSTLHTMSVTQKERTKNSLERQEKVSI
jgi:hypothetical protein